MGRRKLNITPTTPPPATPPKLTNSMDLTAGELAAAPRARLEQLLVAAAAIDSFVMPFDAGFVIVDRAAFDRLHAAAVAAIKTSGATP